MAGLVQSPRRGNVIVSPKRTAVPSPEELRSEIIRQINSDLGLIHEADFNQGLPLSTIANSTVVLPIETPISLSAGKVRAQPETTQKPPLITVNTRVMVDNLTDLDIEVIEGRKVVMGKAGKHTLPPMILEKVSEKGNQGGNTQFYGGDVLKEYAAAMNRKLPSGSSSKPELAKMLRSVYMLYLENKKLLNLGNLAEPIEGSIQTPQPSTEQVFPQQAFTMQPFAPQAPQQLSFAPQAPQQLSQAQQLSFAPQAQQLSFAPQAQQLSFAPQAQSLSFAPQAQQLSFAPQAQSLSFAPQAQSLSFAPQAPQAPSLIPQIQSFFPQAQPLIPQAQ